MSPSTPVSNPTSYVPGAWRGCDCNTPLDMLTSLQPPHQLLHHISYHINNKLCIIIHFVLIVQCGARYKREPKCGVIVHCTACIRTRCNSAGCWTRRSVQITELLLVSSIAFTSTATRLLAPHLSPSLTHCSRFLDRCYCLTSPASVQQLSIPAFQLKYHGTTRSGPCHWWLWRFRL
jgi:hypothetical protein